MILNTPIDTFLLQTELPTSAIAERTVSVGLDNMLFIHK